MSNTKSITQPSLYSGSNLSSSSVSSTSTLATMTDVSEQTPLIRSKCLVPPGELTDRLFLVGGPPSYRTEIVWLFKSSVPIVATYLLQNSLQMASVLSLGHLGATELAASALASMFASVTGWSLSSGATTALDTLCSNAWTGATDKTIVGIHLQRALIFLGIMFFPIACIWWNAESLLLALGQEAALSQHAGLFLRYLLLGAPAYMTFEALKRYLQAQGIMHATTYVLLIASPINMLTNYIFVWWTPISLGFVGAPLATALSYWLMLGLLLLYIKYVAGGEAWGGWSRQCLTGWSTFLKLAVPGVLMVCTEWWAFELVALAASYLGTVSLAAQSIILTTSAATYCVPFGIAIAASNRIGNLLGAQLPDHSRIASNVGILFAFFFGLLNSFVLLALKDVWGLLFTSDPAVITLVSIILPLCAIFQIADGLASICGGILRGMGRQNFGAALNLVAYYGCALPLGTWLTFSNGWGLKGLWTGLCVALFVIGVGEWVFVGTTNWRKEVKRCLDRIDEEECNNNIVKDVV